MSGGTSAIVNLYIAIYGHAPSSQTTEALIRAEQVLGITEGDALARFYVVLLHSADRVDKAVGSRTADEKKFIDGLRKETANLTKIVREVDDAGRKVMRIAKRRGSMLSDDDLVAVDRSASPLFAYLRHAFYFSSHGEGDDERIKADNHRYKEKMVETGFFDLEGAENISAVVFSNAGTLAKFDRMGVDAGFAPDDHRYFRFGTRVDPDPNAVVGTPFHEEVTADYGEGWSDEIQVFHNPLAKLPLPLEAFAGTTQHRFEDGNHISLSKGEPVLSSNTLIMRVVENEQFNETQI